MRFLRRMMPSLKVRLAIPFPKADTKCPYSYKDTSVPTALIRLHHSVGCPALLLQPPTQSSSSGSA